MKLLLILIFGTMFLYPVSAQNYTRDMGIRFGGLPAFTYRQYNGETEALELIASTSWRNLRLTAMKEYFKPAFMQFSNNINFVYGYGAHVGFTYSDRYRLLFKTYYLDEWRLSPVFGIDAILGFEYTPGDLPFIFGIDFKPFFEFSTTRIFYIFLDDASLSLKYKF